MIRHPFFRLGLLAAFGFLLGFSYNYHLPRIESFLLTEVERLSQRHSPVRIWADKLHFHLLPLGIVLEDVRLLPQEPLSRYLAPAHLKEAGARLAILPLLRGEVRLSQVFIRDSELNIFLKPDLFTGGKGHMKLDFKELYRLPVDELSFERVRLQGRLEPQNLVFKVDNLNLDIENRYRSLFVELVAPSVQLKPSGPMRPLSADLEVRTLIEAKEVQVSAFKLRADDSFVVASGHFNGDIPALGFDNGAFDARAKLNLPDLNAWEGVFFADPLIPPVHGRAEIDVGIEARRGRGPRIETDINTDGLQIDKFRFDKIQGHLTSDLKTLTSDGLTFQSDAGKIEVSKLKAALDANRAVSASVKVSGLELRRFLENIGVHHVPLLLPLSGEANCQGSWGFEPQLGCHSKISTPRLWVHSGSPQQKTIVEAGDLRAEGDVQIGTRDVRYKAELQVGKNSKGRSQGVINYKHGFSIAFEGDNVDFADLKDLSGLKLEGSAKLRGGTEGDADHATFSMNLEGKGLWLDDYPFGDLRSELSYKAGHLRFNSVQGQYVNTRYNGALELDLHRDRLHLTAEIPFADLHDVKQLFQRKLDLPFEVAGTGQGHIEAEGPLRFRDLSYKLRSSFYRGELAHETYDELTFNVTAKDGLVSTDRVTLSKATGVAEAKGRVTPDGDIDTVVVGRSLRLEQSETILQYGLDLQGLADFTLLIRGRLPHPRIELNGRLSRMILADQPAQDSVFKLNFLGDRMEGSGQFLGTTLLADVTYPYDDHAPFMLKLKADKWDLTSLFSVVAKSARQLDFSTSITGQVNLTAPHGGFWASSGKVEVDKFDLRKGAKNLTSSKPMVLSIRDGQVNSDGFAISSGDSYLKFDAVDMTRDHLNASLNGKLDLSLLGLFTPFISDLRGNMALSMDLKGSLEKPAVSGSAYVDKGYVKFADFVHPFSDLRADVLFNDNQILLNSVRSDFAGGTLSGDGRITFAGDRRPVDVKGVFSNVKLNIPEGFKTRGSGSVSISGSGFPYLMGINYTVSGGEIVYELGQDSGGTSSIKASPYLPRFLYQEAFHPFTFNVDVDLKHPVNVNTSLAQAQIDGHIAAAGTPDRILLTGTLTPRPGGKIFFHDTPFDISSAFIEYAGAPPSAPKIFLTANTRVTEISQEDSGTGTRTSEKPYDINLLVQGRGPMPEILLTSQPPLPQQDIVSLLTLGVTTGAMDEKKSSEFQAANSSAALGATLLQKAGGKRIKESLGVDLKVSSSQPTPEMASTPKVTLSKQWTPKFGASASSTLQANPTNNVKVEYKMNKSMSVVGSWDGREYVQGQQDAARNVFGLDLEYKLQFK